MSEEVEEVDVCPVCQEIFLEKAILRSHMKEVHLKEARGKSEADESRSGRRPTVVANLEKKQRSLAEYSAGKHEQLTEVSMYKVNRCLARYSPRATTTNRPTNRALNKPAWPGPN